MKEKQEKETAKCNDSQCPIHGELAARGRIFQATVIKKFAKRIVVSFDRTVFIKKYERYSNKRTKLHARLPECMQDIQVGDFVEIRECRPLSKIIHFVTTNKIKSAEHKK